MKFAQEHVDAAAQRISGRDQELLAEFDAKLAKNKQFLSAEHIDTQREKLGIGKDVALADKDNKNAPTALGGRLLETIVRPELRPVLLIRDNKVTLEFLGAESEVWRARLTRASRVLDRVIPSVGRVELDNHPDYTWVGTGWLVDQDVIVTNRHVAREFARRSQQGFVFRSGLAGAAMNCTLDFLEEYERGSEVTFGVESVLWISNPDGPDVAFLRLRRDPQRALPTPVPLAASVRPDALVATIGYPARDSRIVDQDLVRKIFGDIYEKKRLAPGQVLGVDVEELQHDCSTLGGNSGSLVVDLETGEAVGLHFAGQFMLANYAVPSTRIAALLRDLRSGTLVSGLVAPVVANPVNDSASSSPLPSAIATGKDAMRFRINVPLDITVSLGGSDTTAAALSAAPTAAPTPIADPTAPEHLAAALEAARAALRGNANILDVRLGYRFKRGWITDERVVVVEVRNKLSIPELARTGTAIIPSAFGGVGVDVRTGGILEQLAYLGIDMSGFDLEGLEGRVKPGSYREPPDLTLAAIDENVEATFHVSPDAGFPTLSAFLSRVKTSLTATMYEWEAEHVSDAVEKAIKRGKKLTMVTQFAGTHVAVADMQQRLGSKFEHIWASVGAGRLIPNAYHIKVASRDGEELWLSSGNWKSSNQPDIDPIGDATTTIGALRKYNRDWHVVLANPKLATLFQRYIEWDFEEAERVPREEVIEQILPEFFVPEAIGRVEERPEVKYFEPLVFKGKLAIQPLLTPDRNLRDERMFMAFATQLVRAAKHRLYIQNQSFALLDEGNNEDAFEAFFSAIKARQDAGVDVRIVFRDPREFSYDTGSETLARTLERCKDFGLDTDTIKVQKRLHAKAIMVDGEQVLLGSHNLTNAGSLYNRDASLIVRNAEVTEYFEKIFLYDWAVLAVQNADESVGDMQIAKPSQPTPPGYRRMTMAELGFSL